MADHVLGRPHFAALLPAVWLVPDFKGWSGWAPQNNVKKKHTEGGAFHFGMEADGWQT
jgi:hypothetical protein